MFTHQMAVGGKLGIMPADVEVTAINSHSTAVQVGNHMMFGFTSGFTSVKPGDPLSCWANAVRVPAATPTFPLTDGLRTGPSLIAKSYDGNTKIGTVIAIASEFVGLVQGDVVASVRGLDASTAVPQYAVFWPVANQLYLATGLTANRPAAGVQYKGIGLEGWTTPGVVATETKRIYFQGLAPLGVE